MTNRAIIEYALISYIENLKEDVSSLNDMKKDGLDTSALIESKINEINQARVIYNNLDKNYIDKTEGAN